MDRCWRARARAPRRAPFWRGGAGLHIARARKHLPPGPLPRA